MTRTHVEEAELVELQRKALECGFDIPEPDRISTWERSE